MGKRKARERQPPSYPVQAVHELPISTWAHEAAVQVFLHEGMDRLISFCVALGAGAILQAVDVERCTLQNLSWVKVLGYAGQLTIDWW